MQTHSRCPPSCLQAPYHTSSKHGDEDALQYNNSLSGVTGKVGAGGNNYSRPEGQNVRGFPCSPLLAVSGSTCDRVQY